jgi:hypothetical protein
MDHRFYAIESSIKHAQAVDEVFEYFKQEASKNDKSFLEFKILSVEENLDIYETPTKDSVDFLVELGAHTTQILNPKSRTFNPFLIGFRNGKKIAATNLDGICYCIDGVVEIIALTDPDKFSESLLGIEKEDLE